MVNRFCLCTVGQIRRELGTGCFHFFTTPVFVRLRPICEVMGPAAPPGFPQAQAFWYQWLLCTHPGMKKFVDDPVAFGKAEWDAWSPPGWYTDEEFAQAAVSWKGRDFADVVLHYYRSRWGHADLDPRYARQQARFEATQTLAVPTLLLHGRSDRCTLPESTDAPSIISRLVIAGCYWTGSAIFRNERTPMLRRTRSLDG